MARTKVADADLRAYLDEGHSQAEAARHFGVSEPAIHQRLKRLRRLTTQVVALERAGAVVDEQLTATARLERVQRLIDEELAWAVEHARGDGSDLITAFHACSQGDEARVRAQQDPRVRALLAYHDRLRQRLRAEASGRDAPEAGAHETPLNTARDG
jgi:hypothetical protein